MIASTRDRWSDHSLSRRPEEDVMPDHKAESILIALTSHGQLGDTGRATGAYLPEIAHPWSVFKAAGYSVDLASVEGGDPPLDGVDLDDPIQRQFTEDSQMSQKLATTMTPKDVHPNDYAAIFFAGGHGSMWDFPDNAEFARIAIDIYERGGVIGAVCHGPAALVNMTLPNLSLIHISEPTRRTPISYAVFC